MMTFRLLIDIGGRTIEVNYGRASTFRLPIARLAHLVYSSGKINHRAKLVGLGMRAIGAPVPS
jgi:hypothetical protein